MRKVIGTLLAIALVTGVALVANRPGPAGAQGGGTIEATVTFAGAPVVEKLKVNKDTEKCGTEAVIEKVVVGPFAAASVTPLPFCQRRRYTPSEASPMRKYGRSGPGRGWGGNCSEIASAYVFFAASSTDCVGSSHVRWKAISLS